MAGPEPHGQLALATTVVELADHRKVAPAQLALAWVLSRGPDVVPIPGTKRVRYVKQNVGALSVELTEADLAALDPLARQVVGERYAPPS